MVVAVVQVPVGLSTGAVVVVLGMRRRATPLSFRNTITMLVMVAREALRVIVERMASSHRLEPVRLPRPRAGVRGASLVVPGEVEEVGQMVIST